MNNNVDQSQLLVEGQKWLIAKFVLVIVSAAIAVFGTAGYFIVKGVAETTATNIAREKMHTTTQNAEAAANKIANDRLDRRFEAVANTILKNDDFIKMLHKAIDEGSFKEINLTMEKLKPGGKYYLSLENRIFALEPEGEQYIAANQRITDGLNQVNELVVELQKQIEIQKNNADKKIKEINNSAILQVNGRIRIAGECFMPRTIVRCGKTGDHVTWFNKKEDCESAGYRFEGIATVLASC